MGVSLMIGNDDLKLKVSHQARSQTNVICLVCAMVIRFQEKYLIRFTALLVLQLTTP